MVIVITILLLKNLHMAYNFASRLKQANLASKNDFADNLKSLNKVTSKKGNQTLVQNELNKLSEKN